MAGTYRSESHVARLGRRLNVGGRRSAPRLLWALLLGGMMVANVSAATGSTGIRVDIVLNPPPAEVPGGGGGALPPGGGGTGGGNTGGVGVIGGGGAVIPAPGGGGTIGTTPPVPVGGSSGLCTSLSTTQSSGATVRVACNGSQFVSITPSAGHESAASYGDVFRVHFGAGSLFALDEFVAVRSRFGLGGTLTGVRIENITEAEKLVEMLVSF